MLPQLQESIRAAAAGWAGSVGGGGSGNSSAGGAAPQLVCLMAQWLEALQRRLGEVGGWLMSVMWLAHQGRMLLARSHPLSIATCVFAYNNYASVIIVIII